MSNVMTKLLPTGKVIPDHKTFMAITEIDRFTGGWQATQALAPDRLRAAKRVAMISSVGASTRIEGTQMTNAEVEELLFRKKRKSLAARDEQEVAGCAKALQIVLGRYTHISLTESNIKQLHSIMMQYSPKDEHHSGHYKKIPNRVESFDHTGRSLGVVLETATPFATPAMMEGLVNWYNKQSDRNKQHPLLLIAVFIVVFLAIHPFTDGNGRMARLLTTLLLLRAGYLWIAYSSMDSIIEEHREEYYLALRTTQKTLHSSTKNWQPWLAFFIAKVMLLQKHNLANLLQEEQALQERMPSLSRAILDLVQIRGEVSVQDIVAELGANRNTVRTHLRRLTIQKYLQLIGKGRGARYVKK